MKILVTGANGYLGIGIVKRLLDDGIQVAAADFTLDKCDDRAEKFACDLFSIESPYEYFGRPDVLLHLAWRDGFVHYSDAHIEDLPKHHKFLKSFAQSDIKRIAVMGSMHEVGFYEGSIDENSPCKPQSLYGIAKNALRQDLEVLAKANGKEFQWLRGYYIVGNTAYGCSIFSKLYKAALEKKCDFPFTMGQNQFDFIDYPDFCLKVAAAVEQSAECGVINICSGRPEKLADRVERFIKENNFSIKLKYGAFPDRPYDSKAVWGNSQKIEKIMQNRQLVLVTGVAGQLGHDVVNELNKRGILAVGSDLAPTYGGVNDNSYVTRAPYVSMDITDGAAVERVISDVKPTAVIHCAAWTAVDAAEDENNRAKVFAINAGGTKNIADACKKIGAKMMYISTDYVFDGQGTEPWQPDCKDYKPMNVYGESKLEGEKAVAETIENYFIVRIAWVFGLNGKNFIKTMLNVGKAHDTVRVVNDQIGTPTYTFDLARLLADMILTEKYGYYHATNEGGYISWYDFTKEIYRQAGYDTKVIPVSTAEYGLSKAARPYNSRLDKSKLSQCGFTPLPPWQDAVARYLKEITE